MLDKKCNKSGLLRSSAPIFFTLVSSPIWRLVGRSAGSIGARSAPSTPSQAVLDAPQAAGQQSISGSQLAVAGASYPQPPRSPSHAALRCNDRWGPACVYIRILCNHKSKTRAHYLVISSKWKIMNATSMLYYRFML